jgi:hypothetical protein
METLDKAKQEGEFEFWQLKNSNRAFLMMYIKNAFHLMKWLFVE